MRREFDQLSESYNRTQTALVGEVVNVAGKKSQHQNPEPQGGMVTMPQAASS
jgi:hypothetical protein